jgi:hypothetical protein
MTAAQRLAALDDLAATDLCARAAEALTVLIEVINEETTLLRAGRVRDATALTARKAELAQDYVGWSRAVQRQASRLKAEAPDALAALQHQHEALATQLAENLRVIASARAVTEDLLGDVARAVGAADRARTYGAAGTLAAPTETGARGLAVNRAL